MSQSLQTSLAEILDLRDSLASPIRSLVRPPLPPAERTALLAQTGVKVPGILHAHPTLSEALKEAALNVDQRSIHI